LRCARLTDGDGQEVTIDVNIRRAISQAGFQNPRVTDIFWPREELYRAGEEEEKKDKETDAEGDTNGANDAEEGE
jgi:sRNA-binding carbon storage regulator CsrA